MRGNAGAMFRALRHRNYRIFFWGQFVSMCGTWLQMVAQTWLVVKLSDNNGLAVGVVTAMQTVPSLLFGPASGVIVDRFAKRTILLVMQVVLSGVAVGLAILVWTGSVRLWNVALLSFIAGMAGMIDLPTRQALVNEMVPSEDLVNAVGLNSAMVHGARVVGPVFAIPLLRTVGMGWCFFLNGLSFVAAIVTILAVDSAALREGPRLQRAKGQVRDGLRYLRSQPLLRANLEVLAIMGVLATNFPVLLPFLAKDTFDGGEALFGNMNVAMGLGAFGGSLIAASRGRCDEWSLVIPGFGMGVALFAAAAAPSVALVLPILLIVSVFNVIYFSTSNTLVQLGADPAFRGRVLAVRVTTFMGGAAIGAPLTGAIVRLWGPRWALVIGGAATIFACTRYVLTLRRVGLLRPPADDRLADAALAG